MTNILGESFALDYNRTDIQSEIDYFMTSAPIFRGHIALPQDHGSWVFVFSPLLVGLFAGGDLNLASVLLVITVMAAFLIRQPITVAVKVYSGRRSRRDLPAARFWIVLYGLVCIFAFGGLIYQGFSYLVYLAVPGILVFIWHLYLVSKRRERNQPGVEIVASGVLSLAAPAAMWVGLGSPDIRGWLLFGLLWLQSAGSIVYAYLRLEQRALSEMPDRRMRFAMGKRALLYTTFNFLLVLTLSIAAITPQWLPLAYAVQSAETLWGALIRPAVGQKPTRIGIRQLIVSTLFTIVFILTWNL